MARKGVLSGGVLGLNTLYRGCSSHTTLVELLYPGGDKYRASVQIVLCNSFLYTNNIHKYYSVSRCVIFIIIVIAPTICTTLDEHLKLWNALMVNLHAW